MFKLTAGQECKNKSLSLSLSLLAAPAVLSIATLSALFLFLPPNNASAISNHSLSISTNTPALESTINTIPDETITIQKHEITINTNNPNGAKLFISSKDNKTVPEYITNSGPATGSGSTGISAIAEATGALNNPATLSPNSFGFALDKNSSTIATNFSTNTTYESTDNTDKLTAKFAKLPDINNMAETHSISTTANNNKLSVYYGTNTNSLMREGKYELDILYTIVSNTPTTDIPEDNNDTIETSPKLLPVRENQTFYKDNTITVKTNIKANRSIIPADIIIKINNKSCTDITITKNFDNNTNNPAKKLELTCKAPQNPVTQAGSKYDLNLTISKYSINTTKKNAVNYIIPTPMQTFQYSMCQNMQTHDEKYVIDTRDDELYTMAKLKDGKCWMTENLRYQLSTTRALTPQDSDVQQNWTPNRSTETILSGRWDQDSEGTKTVRSYYDSTKPEYGTYYTHTAATAGTTANMDNDGDEATGSICPKGWRLPKATIQPDSPNSDFYMMAKHYINPLNWRESNGYWGWERNKSEELYRGVPKYVPAGGRFENGIKNINDISYTWSSMVGRKWVYKKEEYAFHMLIHQDAHSVTPNYSLERYSGFNVRCIARESKTIGSLEYMQDMTPEHCTNSTEHQTATLKDKRDNETYTVAKLKDGKCWMTQNLRLRLSTGVTLVPQTSDVSYNWTPNRSTETTFSERWDQVSETARVVRSYYDASRPNDGVYYNHIAATAESANNLNVEGQNASSSVCPKGWRLPRATRQHDSADNEFYTLMINYLGSASWGWYRWNGAHNLLASPQNFTLSGIREYSYDNGILGLGVSVQYWSSTVYDNIEAFSFFMGNNVLQPNNHTIRQFGYLVRCLAR